MSSPKQSDPSDSVTLKVQAPSSRDRSASVDVQEPVPKDHRSSSLVNPVGEVGLLTSLSVQPQTLQNIFKGVSHDSGRETQGSSRDESIEKEPSSDASEAKTDSIGNQDDASVAASVASGSSSSDEKSTGQESSNGQTSSDPSGPSITIPFSGDESGPSIGPKSEYSSVSEVISEDQTVVRHTPHPIGKCKIVKPKLSPVAGPSGISAESPTVAISSARTKTMATTTSVPPQAVKQPQPTPIPPVIEHWYDRPYTGSKYGAFILSIFHIFGVFVGLWFDMNYKEGDTYTFSLFLITLGCFVCTIFATFEKKGGVKWSFVALLMYIPLHVIFLIDLPVAKLWWFYTGNCVILCLLVRITTELICHPNDYYRQYISYRYAVRHHEIFDEIEDLGEVEALAGETRSSIATSKGENRGKKRGKNRVESRGKNRGDSRGGSSSESDGLATVEAQIESESPPQSTTADEAL